MKIYMTLWFAFFCGFGGFAKIPKTQEAVVRFEVKNSSLKTLVLNYMIDNITGKSDTLTIKNGHAEKRFLLSKPLYIHISDNNFWGRIFLAPNYHSKIVLDRNKKIKGLIPLEAFEDGSHANNYLDAIRIETANSMPKSSLSKGVNLDEEQYIIAFDKYLFVRDSIYNYYLNKSKSILNKDKYVAFFFENEKKETRFFKGNSLLSFISNRRYHGSRAESFFAKYVQPLGLQNKTVNFYVLNSQYFFESHYLNYIIGRKRETDDSTKLYKIGHYAYALALATKIYGQVNREYAVTSLLNFLVTHCRSYPTILPSIDSLLKVYEPYIMPNKKEMLWKNYRLNIAPDPYFYSENKIIDDFQIKAIDAQELNLKDKLTDITIIDLWASWCGNCIEAFPFFEQLEKQFENEKRVSWLKVSIDDDPKIWENSSKKLGLKSTNNFWISGGFKSVFAKKMEIDYLPRHVVLNKEGKILKMYAPDPRGKGQQKLIALVNDYLKKIN